MHSIERKSNSSCYINAILFLPGIFHFQEKFVTWNTFNFNIDIKIWTLSLQDKIFLMHFIGKESMHHPVSQYNQSFDKFLIEKKLYIHLLICQHWNGHNNSFQRRLSMNMSIHFRISENILYHISFLRKIPIHKTCELSTWESTRNWMVAPRRDFLYTYYRKRINSSLCSNKYTMQ